MDATNSFVGKVTIDDTANPDETSGTAAFDSITDFFSFDNDFRGWGKDGTAFPNADNQGACGTGETCRIWDWSLAAGDSGDAGGPVALGVVPMPTGNDFLVHTFSDATSVTFLRNAVEIMFDEIGNDNGLCESDETCLYTPNIGAYQGHGDLIPAGTIGTGGVISNVTLMQYENDGY